MATLQAARAKALGLSDEEAKSFGLNRAIFYAAAKRGFKGGSTKKPGGKISVKFSPLHREEKTLDLESVGNEQAYAVHLNGKRYFVMGDDILDEKDFARQVERPFGETFDMAWHEAMNLVEHTDRDVLESQKKFYEEVYKPHRDELANRWSGEESS